MSKDEMTDASALVALLDAVEVTPGARRLRERSYDLLGVGPGVTVLDMGCGAGRAVAEMAGRGARAVGVDADARMVAVARERWARAEFRVATAYELPCGDGVANGYRADKVFHELADPARALGEARRVLAPGGQVVLVGQDWDTVVIEADDAALTRAIVRARADLLPGPRVARRYRNLLLDAGFQDVTVEVHTGVFTGSEMLPLLTGLAEAACSVGAIDRDQADSWTAEQHHRARADRLFLALPMFVAAATARPGTPVGGPDGEAIRTL